MTPITRVLTFLLLSVLWITPWATADERKVTATVSLKQEYTDNLFFTSYDREEDFISTVSPGLGLINNTERLKSELKVRLDSLYYMENSDLDSIDQDYSGSLRYALSPRANVFTSAQYIRDSRSDRDFIETGLITRAVNRDRYIYRLGGDYVLTELMGIQLKYGYDADAYDSEGYSDYQSHDIACTLTRDMSDLFPSTIGRVTAGTTFYSDDNSDSTNYYGTIGAEHSVSELYKVFADVGLRYTDSQYDSARLVPSNIPFFYMVVPYEAHAKGTGLTGRAGLTYTGELHTATMAFSHAVTQAGGYDGTVERTALQGDVSRRLTETSRISFSAGYARNKSTEDELLVDEVDEDSLWLQPKLTYTLTERIVLEAFYNYAFIHDNLDNEDRERNLVFLRLGFNYPILE